MMPCSPYLLDHRAVPSPASHVWSARTFLYRPTEPGCVAAAKGTCVPNGGESVFIGGRRQSFGAFASLTAILFVPKGKLALAPNRCRSGLCGRECSYPDPQ